MSYFGFSLNNEEDKKKKETNSITADTNQANVGGGASTANISTPIGNTKKVQPPTSSQFGFSLGGNTQQKSAYDPNANHAAPPPPQKPVPQPQSPLTSLVSTLKTGLAQLEQVISGGQVQQPSTVATMPQNSSLGNNPTNTQSAQVNFVAPKQNPQQQPAYKPGETALVQAPPQTVWDKVKDTFKNIVNTIEPDAMKGDTTSEIARAMNAYAIQKVSGDKLFDQKIQQIAKQEKTTPEKLKEQIDQQVKYEHDNGNKSYSKLDAVGLSLQKLSEPGGNIFKESTAEQVTKELGIRDQLSNKEAADLLMSLSLPLSLAAAPELAGGKGLSLIPGAAEDVGGIKATTQLAELGKFTAVSTAFDAGFQKLTGKQTVSDLLPDGTPMPIKTAVDALEFLGKGIASHGLAVPQYQDAVDLLTKNTIEQYKLPEKVTIPADKMASIFGNPSSGAKISPEELELVKAAGLSSSSYRDAVKYGLDIEVPSTKIVQITDKPYWAKLKSIIGQESAAKTLQFREDIPTAGNHISGALPAETNTLQPLKKTPFDTADIVQARNEQNAIPSTHEINTPERDKFRADTATQIYDNGGFYKAEDRPATQIKQEKRADIVLGAPAAGKSTLFVNPLIKRHGSVLVDSDEAKLAIPESQGSTYAGAAHKESVGISLDVMDKALNRGDNIVLPIVGKNVNNVKTYIDALNKEGYSVHLHLNDLPPEKAAQRAIERFKTTGRFVDPNYVLNEVGLKPKENYAILKAEPGVTSYEAYSNDVPRGEKPKLIEQGTNQRPGGVHGTEASGANAGTPAQSQDLLTQNNLEDGVTAVSLVKEALHSGDEEGAKIIYDSFAKENNSLPKYASIVEQINTEHQAELDAVQKELESTRGDNPDDPTNKILDIADKLNTHFKARGNIFQITGSRRILSDNGDVLTLGGDAKGAFDRLINATDIDGFAKNIRLLAQKHGGTFQDIHDMIRSGGIDGADYERFKEYFNKVRAEESTKRTAGSRTLQGLPEQKQSEALTGSLQNPRNSRLSTLNPVGQGKIRESAAFKKFVDSLQETDPQRYEQLSGIKVTYNVNKAADDAENAIRYVSSQPKEALQVAKGLRNPPEGQTAAAITLAMAEKLDAEGKGDLAASLQATLSLRATRFGQENAALRGRFNDDSPYKFIKQVVDARLNVIGRDTQSFVQNNNPLAKTSLKEKAFDKIDRQVESLTKELKAAKEVKPKKSVAEDLQSFIDSITCK